MKAKFPHVHIGDVVRVHNKSDNVALKAGVYDMKVVDKDKRSFAVESFGKWWFYRDSGEAYAGDAIIVKTL